MERIEKRQPGPPPIFKYNINDASEYLKTHSEVVLLVPALQDYLLDMTRKAGRSNLAAPNTFYKYVGQSIDIVAEYSGLEAIGENRVAGIIEGDVPEFVLEKIVRTIGRDALLAYLERTSLQSQQTEVEQ